MLPDSHPTCSWLAINFRSSLWKADPSGLSLAENRDLSTSLLAFNKDSAEFGTQSALSAVVNGLSLVILNPGQSPANMRAC